jgi:hypothetical protein
LVGDTDPVASNDVATALTATEAIALTDTAAGVDLVAPPVGVAGIDGDVVATECDDVAPGCALVTAVRSARASGQMTAREAGVEPRALPACVVDMDDRVTELAARDVTTGDGWMFALAEYESIGFSSLPTGLEGLCAGAALALLPGVLGRLEGCAQAPGLVVTAIPTPTASATPLIFTTRLFTPTPLVYLSRKSPRAISRILF